MILFFSFLLIIIIEYINMPPKGGGKKKKSAKAGGFGPSRRELLFKDDGQEYAQVVKMLGNGHVELDCCDDIKRLGTIRGKMRKRVWIQTGDVVLVGLREYQDGKADIIHKYNPEEVKNLRNLKEIPENIVIQENAASVDVSTILIDVGGEEETEDTIDFI
jgi:translation initiation factor 1A